MRFYTISRVTEFPNQITDSNDLISFDCDAAFNHVRHQHVDRVTSDPDIISGRRAWIDLWNDLVGYAVFEFNNCAVAWRDKINAVAYVPFRFSRPETR